ncbi:MAG: BrxE family protein [Myxococcales bacterium]|nr:BrxE family protein [Myxococcales bacterium]
MIATDLDRLLKLRLAVARFGEMDLAGWWNTKGQLGRYGAIALRRGFPRTHHFAQARSVFAVAAHRCAEVFAPPKCATLWNLPETIEAEFEARWEHWLDTATTWVPFFERLQGLPNDDVGAALRDFELVTAHDLEAASKLKRSAEGAAIMLPGVFEADRDLTSLALGFARCEPGTLSVPYIALGDA